MPIQGPELVPTLFSRSKEMKLYHVTKKANAKNIEQNGFQDCRNTGHDLCDAAIQFASRPIFDDENVFPNMNPEEYVYFEIEVPDERLEEYEFPNKEGVDYREFEIPLNEANAYFTDRVARAVKKGH